MARSATSRRQETLFVPFVEEVEPDQFGGAQFAVKVRNGRGAKIWMTDGMPKRMAARRLRQIREQMFQAWEDAKLLSDANSHYSAVQAEEIARS